MSNIDKLVSYTSFLVGVLLALSIIFPSVIINGLTSSEILFKKLLEEKYHVTIEEEISIDLVTLLVLENSSLSFSGAICNDGWVSHSQGRGTCSHHGGVNYYFYAGDYTMTKEEATMEAIEIEKKYRKKARRRSWID